MLNGTLETAAVHAFCALEGAPVLIGPQNGSQNGAQSGAQNGAPNGAWSGEGTVTPLS